MRYKVFSIIVLTVCLGLIGLPSNAKAAFINFDDQGLTGPSYFASASPSPQQLIITTILGNVQFDGGVILTNASGLSNQTSVYGTADFGNNLSNLLTITFPLDITNLSLDVYNGESFGSSDYTVFDNSGNSNTFTLASGGMEQVFFSAAGNVIYVQSPSSSWDFFIDNIQFDGTPATVPLPSTLLLMGSGLLCLAYYRRRKSASS